VDSASPHEVKLVPKTIEGRFLVQLPKRVIGDKAYDRPAQGKQKKPKPKMGEHLEDTGGVGRRNVFSLGSRTSGVGD